MDYPLSIQSTVEGVSAKRVFVPVGEHLAAIHAPDWDNGKSAQILYSSDDEEYRPLLDSEGCDSTFAADEVMYLHVGGFWVALSVTNAGTGVRLDIYDKPKEVIKCQIG